LGFSWGFLLVFCFLGAHSFSSGADLKCARRDQKKELGMTNPLRALGGTRGQAQREMRPKEQGWRDAGSAALALGGLAHPRHDGTP
jgi:hypothetical protein